MGSRCARTDSTNPWSQPATVSNPDDVWSEGQALGMLSAEPVERAASHLAAIVESSDDAIVSKNLDGMILSWNPAAQRMFGYTADEAIGRSIRMVIPPDRQHEEDEVLSRVRHGERVEHFETVRCRKDGSLFHVSLSVSPIRDSGGRIIGASKIARDITAAKAADAELHRVQAERAEIIDSVVDCVLTTDRHGLIRDFNPAAEAAFRYRREEVIGQSVNELLLVPPVGDSGSPVSWLPDLEGTAEPLTARELVARRADGTEFTIELRLSGSGDGGYIAIFHDISARKLEEEALRRSMEAKDQFLSLVSHELRTPTAIIVGNGEILLRRADEMTETDRRQALEDILSQATRLHGTIENLLLLTRLERDSDLNREPVHLERVLQSAMATQLQRSPQAKIVYRSLGSTTAPPFVLGEPTLITLVADNLIGNAIKYSDPETPIEVTLDAEDPGQIEVHVLDRGIGVGKNECEWIFTPFYRSRAAVARASGMGIGLAVCRRIVEAQGGWIKASPRQGGGSDFAFALPTVAEGQGQDGDSTPSTG